mmetsp:Transcript_40931/g.73791  ORF Transcript_40931/g.73791 Transcript_40931/m.73791 type:complete len:310 (+) Transcript_40931:435-1364(+)
MVWVDLQNGLVEASHHAGVGSAARDILGLHVLLHRGTHAVRALDQCRGTVGEEICHFNLLDLAGQCRFEVVLHGLVCVVQFLLLLLAFFLVFVAKVESLLRNIKQLEILVFRHRFNHDFIQRFRQVQYLVSPTSYLLSSRTHLRLLLAIGRNVVNLFLILLHALDILIEARVLISSTLGRVESKQGDDIVLVALIFNDAHLHVLAKVIPKHDVFAVVLITLDSTNHVQTLAHEAFVDDAEHFGLLQDLSRDIQGQILRIDHSPDKLEPAGHDVLKLVIDEDTFDVQSNITRVFVKHILGQLKREHARNV